MNRPHQTPPRNGEGDHPAEPDGGGVTPAVLKASSAAFRTARRERRSYNLPEVLIWRELRKRPAGLKFRRQHPIGDFSLDFACLVAKLAIEIDGEAHSRGNRPARDEHRDQALAQRGFETLRIPAKDVLTDLNAVIRMIIAKCEARPPLHRPMGGPPPRSGEVSVTE